MIITILLLSAIGGLILLDKMAIGEFGLSQPIVACPLIGLIFGELYIGLLVGCMLQLVWVGALPLGSKESLDNQGAGVVAITVFLLLSKTLKNNSVEKIIFTSLLFAALASIVGQYFTQVLKKINNKLFHRVNRNSSNRTIIITHFSGLINAFLRGYILILLFLLIAVLVTPYIRHLPDFKLAELLVLPLIIGIAGIAHLVIIKKYILVCSLGILSGVFLWVLLK